MVVLDLFPCLGCAYPLPELGLNKIDAIFPTAQFSAEGYHKLRLMFSLYKLA